MSNFPHWPVRRTGDVFFVKGRIGWRNLRRSDFCEDGPHLITGMHIDGTGRVDWNSCFRIPRRKFDESPEIQVKVGDLVITKDGTIGKVARIDWLPGDTSLNSHLFLVRPIQPEICSARFAFHIFTSAAFRDFIENQKSGSTLAGLGEAKFVQFQFPLPTIKEQVLVADVLDTIDTAIRETEALIDKLKAVKQGLLHDLLTRGIDSNGQLRPPQSEAPQLYKESSLGWISREWEVVPLGSCADIASGVTLGRTLNNPVAIELPYLRVANVQDGYLDLGEIKTVPILPSELNRFALKVGDVLMNEGGDFDKLGRGAVWEGQIDPCLHQNHVFRVRCDDSKLLPAFLAAYSSSVRGKTYFVQASKQTTNLASINSTQLKAFGISCPSVAEQLFITQRLSTFDKKIAVEQEALEKLRQQKIGLMGDLLTGRVRVTPLLESMQQAAAHTEA